jgi:LuxR family maltose regulon positive regulatory protein
VLIPLLNEQAALPTRVILVLDDYHLIEETEIHAGLAYLLEHLPGQVEFVISTRVDPPLPIFRLRPRSQLTEIREARMLRFFKLESLAGAR